MSDDNRRCGTCVHFELLGPAIGFGCCHAPIPECVDAESAECVYRMGGKNRPCWARKETEYAK